MSAPLVPHQFDQADTAYPLDTNGVCAACGQLRSHDAHRFHGGHWTPGPVVLECLDRFTDTPCDGPVEYRYALSPTGTSYPRCDAHWAQRVQIQEGIDRRYPQQQPDDFDPTYAGESWDDDGW